MADGSRSSSVAGIRENALLQWLMPSVADLIFVALLASLVFTPLSVKLLGDAGIGWHIRTGQLILTTHEIPHVDPFSTQIHKPWVAWEWLYDVVVGWLESHAGLNGVVWLTAVVIGVVFAFAFRLLVKRGADFLVALLLTLLAMAASMIHFLTRPHVLSWLFALIWFWNLDWTESGLHRSNRRLWLLPILMLIWVNVHGGFLLGFVLLGIFWVGSLWTWLRLKESRIEESFQKIAAGKHVRCLTLVGVVSAAASFVNPYGWHLHGHIYSYLTNRFFMDHIEEFQSPNFHGIAQRCFLVLLLIALAALAVNGRKLRASGILLVIFAVYAGLYASRNIPVSSILLAAVIGPLIQPMSGGAFLQRMSFIDATLRGHLWPIVATIATFAIAASGGRVGSTVLMDVHFDPQRMPVAAADFLHNQPLLRPNPRGPLLPCTSHMGVLLSPDYWGGYLIYRFYPEYRVAIDDRHDFYGEAFLKSYVTMMHAEPGWEDFLQRQSSCLVLPRKAAITTIISRTQGWEAIYSDDVTVVFAHNLRDLLDSEKVPGD